jgi:hypothetical protein
VPEGKTKAEKAKEATDRAAEAVGGVPRRVKRTREAKDARLGGIMAQIERQRNAQSTDSDN